MLKISPLNLKANIKRNTDANPGISSNPGNINYATNVCNCDSVSFKGVQGNSETVTRLKSFIERFQGIFQELEVRKIVEEAPLSDSYLIFADPKGAKSAIKKYGDAFCMMIGNVINNAKDIPELIKGLSKQRADYPYIMYDDAPLTRLRPIDDTLAARIYEKQLKLGKMPLGYNPHLFNFIKSGKASEVKFAIGHNGQIYNVITQSGVEKFGNEDYKYVELIAKPV